MAYLVRLTEVKEGTRRIESFMAVLGRTGGAYIVSREWGHSNNEHYHAVVYTQGDLREKVKQAGLGGQKVFSMKAATSPERAIQYVLKGPRASRAHGDSKGAPPDVVGFYGVQFNADTIKAAHEAYWAEDTRTARARARPGATRFVDEVMDAVKAQHEVCWRTVMRVTWQLALKHSKMYSRSQLIWYATLVLAKLDTRTSEALLHDMMREAPPPWDWRTENVAIDYADNGVQAEEQLPAQDDQAA